MGRVTYIHHYVRPSHPFPLLFLTYVTSPCPCPCFLHSPPLSPLQRQTRTSSRRSTLPSSWQPTCSTTLSSRPGASPSAQNRLSLPSSRAPSSPTFGGSVASRGASTVRSTTIGDLGGERSVVNFFFFSFGQGRLMIFRSVSRGIFTGCSIELARGGGYFHRRLRIARRATSKHKKHFYESRGPVSSRLPVCCPIYLFKFP
jgi:hypothetical protein